MAGELDYFEFDQRLRQESLQFEKVILRRKNNALYVRGTFPPKPGEFRSARRDLPTGCNATSPGLKVAIAKAKKVDSQLLWGEFDWSPYLKGYQVRPEQVKDWVERYEADHWQHTERNPSKESSFQSCYRHYFGLLPGNEILTIALLEETIISRTNAATRSRQLCCMAYGALAKFVARQGAFSAAEVALFGDSLKRLKQGYRPKPKLPEDLPSEDQIVEIWQSIKNPAWRWVYGMLASYGLRPHEVFHLDLERFTEQTEALRVLEQTKTGARLTYPCLPEWREQFRLWDARLPNIQIEGKSNETIGKKVAQEFRDLKIPHIPYDLRHAWCIRLGLHDVDSAIAAKWAGHSIQVHVKTYQQAISEAQHQQIYNRMKRGRANQLSADQEE